MAQRDADPAIQRPREEGTDEGQGPKRGSRSPRQESSPRRPGAEQESAENSIRPSRRRRRAADSLASEQLNTHSPREEDPQQKPLFTKAPESPGKAESDPWTVPQSVRDRFIQAGHRFHFPDGAPAFRDLGRRLISVSENTEVIHSLIQIAESRGWTQITVTGTQQFRQEAWRQASLAGLSVRGYRPTEVERIQLARSIGRRAESGPDEVRDETGLQVSEPAPDRLRGRRASDERISGTLLDHGRDTYRFDPHEPMSYFVRLKTSEGTRTIWGKDLERAVAQSLSRAATGDDVTLWSNGADSVTVKRRDRDSAGRLLDERDVAARRNRWVIERTDFLTARAAAAATLRDAAMDAKEGVRRHPELAGTYLQIRAAEIAARAIRDPQDQKKFVEKVRGALASSVERGEPLQPVRLRERAATREREQDRARG